MSEERPPFDQSFLPSPDDEEGPLLPPGSSLKEIRELRLKQAEEIREKLKHTQLAESICSILNTIQNENPTDRFLSLMAHGGARDLQNELLNLRRQLDVDRKMKRLSSATMAWSTVFLEQADAFLAAQNQAERLRRELEPYRDSPSRARLSEEQRKLLHRQAEQLRALLPSVNQLREKTLRFFTSYIHARNKDLGEEATLLHSYEKYLQFLDAPQRARLETHITEKISQFTFEERIAALQRFITALVQVSPSVREAEIARHLEMARHFLAQDQAEYAIAELQKALPLGESAVLYLELRNGWARLGDAANEIEALRKAAACDPARLDTSLELGRRLEETGRPAEALAVYQQALRRHPQRFSLLNHAAVLAFDLQQWDAAIPLLLAVREIKPNSLKTLQRLGTALVRAGEFARGAALLNETLRRGADDGLLYLNLGLACQGLGHLHDAHQAFLTAATRLPGHPEITFQLAQSHFTRGDYEETETLCGMLLEKNPADAQAALLRSRALGLMGRHEEKAAVLTPLLQDPATRKDALLEYGLACLKQRQAETAYQTLQQALRLDPADPDIRAALGLACIESGRFQESIAYLAPPEKGS
ncbi:MAG: tetratricopeptide repeat protein [bacterium]